MFVCVSYVHGGDLGSARGLGRQADGRRESEEEPVVFDQVKCRPHKASRAFSIALVLCFIAAIAAYFSLLAYVVHLPRPL
jgi:hypothetical protein